MSPRLAFCFVSILLSTNLMFFILWGGHRSGLQTLPEAVQIMSADEVRLFGNGHASRSVNWNDVSLKRLLRQRWLVGPSTAGESTLTKGDASQVGQSSFVDGLLRGRRNGFFVECGAADGETISNSLFFETQRGWTGLLVEPNPDFFTQLLAKRRNAYSVNACLSTNDSISRVLFQPAGYIGGIPEMMDADHASFIRRNNDHVCPITVTCFPLVALLNALGVDHVDYFSLDVEGPELDILRTIPFDHVTFDVITVEYRVSDMVKIQEQESLKKLEKIRSFFASTGRFKEVGILPWKRNESKYYNERLGLDVIFHRIP